jgi:hypothetical protein
MDRSRCKSLASARDADETPTRELLPSTRASIKLYLTGNLIRSLSLQPVSGPVLSLTQGRSIFQYMGYRYASRAEDEAVCLAILLGKNAGAIPSCSQNSVERMKGFILMPRNFPSFLLFCWETGQNIDEDGFRWAPQTLLGHRSLTPPTFSTRHTNKITIDGSHGMKRGETCGPKLGRRNRPSC